MHSVNICVRLGSKPGDESHNQAACHGVPLHSLNFLIHCFVKESNSINQIPVYLGGRLLS